MIEAAVGLVSDYIVGKLTDHIDELITDLKDKREFQKFRKSLGNWISEFIYKNETSILETSEFDDYLKYYNPIEHILLYITDANSSQYSESQFISHEISEIVEHLNARGRIVTSNDNAVITELIKGLFDLLKTYFESKISLDQIALKYAITQLIKKTDILVSESPKPTTAKLSYAPLSDIIERKAAPFKYIQESSLYFHMDETADLYKICQNERRVILLGDAGSGKTTVLKQVAHHACDDYYTLLIPLSDYSGEEIEHLIRPSYPDYAGLSMFLIFDAFDEIGEKNRDDFARRLNSFIANHPSTRILISVRNNFYKFSNDEGKGSTFNSFKEYGLCPLTTDDIRDYSEQNEIDYSILSDELYRTGVRELSYNPFYLTCLVKLMKKYSHLPTKKELMNEIVKVSFQFDKDKYTNPDVVSESEYKLMQLLKKIAFAMQCMGDKVHICMKDYQSILTEENDRKLMRYSSLFYKNDNEQWQFEHNNFREYLAAKYLNELELEKIKEVLCYDEEKTKIRESWMNVISYLILLYEDNDLFEWLRDVSDSVLVKFEASRMDDEARSGIFIKIFNSYAEKNMWINHSHNSVDELVNFGQSAATLKFLLKEIQKPRHYWALSNALHLLNRFDDLYLKNEETRTVLYDCVLSSETREYEKETAVCALANLGLQTTEITASLINMLETQKSEYFHNGVVYYLIHCGLQEDCIDVLIKELEYSNKQNRGYAGNIEWKIKNAILEIQGRNAIQKVLEYYSVKEYHSSNKKEIFQHLMSRAIYFYQNGDHTVFDVVFHVLLSSQKHYHTVLADICKQFFVKTNTVSKAFEKAVELYLQGSENNDLVLEFLFYIGDEQCVETLTKTYDEKPVIYNQLFWSFTINLPFDSKYLSRCTELLQGNGVAVPPPRKYIDFERIRKEGNQIYFDALFDKAQYQKLIEKLVEIVDDSQVTYDIIQDRFLNLHNHGTLEHEMLLPVVWDIHECNFEDQQVSHFTSQIQDWHWFAISNIYECLSRNAYEVNITEEQMEYIREYCNCAIKEIDFSTEIRDSRNNGTTHSWRLLYFCFFADYFNLEYPKEIVRKLTVVPKHLFDSANSNDRIFSCYVTARLTYDELCECVKHNIVNCSLCLWSKMEHIKFCKENKLSYALDLAEQVCTDSKIDSYDKSVALEYIAVIRGDEKNGYDYIYSNFLATEDEKLLDAIVNVTLSIQSPLLTTRLEEVNDYSENKEKYLEQLIKLQSEFGLIRYYEIAKDKMTIPDYSDHNYTGLTDAISEINSSKLLPLLIELQSLLFTEGFIDHPHFGLRRSLSKAFFNIAKKHDADVLKALEAYLNKGNITSHEKSFCNFVIADIEDACKQRNDIPWSIRKIKQFLKENE